jgi:hypothetical protein
VPPGGNSARRLSTVLESRHSSNNPRPPGKKLKNPAGWVDARSVNARGQFHFALGSRNNAAARARQDA